jgi:hypothetical protein
VSRNPHEMAARARKAAALLATVDRNARFVGMAAPEGIRGVELLRTLNRADWAALARAAGVRPPSRETSNIVLASIEARGVDLAKCAAPPVQLRLKAVS